MSRLAADFQQFEGTIMPPLIYETVAWFRLYIGLAVPALPRESDAGAAPDPARTAYAAPIAGALVGAIGGFVVVIAAALGAANFVAAALGTLALIVVTGGQAESALAATAERSTTSAIIRYGVIAIAVAILLRTGAIDALLAHGVWTTGFAIIGACAVSRAAALTFILMRPVAPEGATPDAGTTALQWLVIAGLAIGIAAVLPFLGLGAAIAGIAAAAGAVALVSAFLPRDTAATGREFAASAELLAEIAFLVAVLAFASR
jgi:adenosylcobinamide-GDP ribazoletransferase